MPRRVLEGNVVSDKMDKTITVSVERRYMHPVYKKYLKKTVKFTAHDENNSCKVGEKVQIIECRPISKRKSWRVISDDVAALAAQNEVQTKTDKAPKKASAENTKAAKPAAKKAPAKKPAAKKPAAKKSTDKK